ncbi:unnamed protein product, partial [Prorocentrum cordatum]
PTRRHERQLQDLAESLPPQGARRGPRPPRASRRGPPGGALLPGRPREGARRRPARRALAGARAALRGAGWPQGAPTPVPSLWALGVWHTAQYVYICP